MIVNGELAIQLGGFFRSKVRREDFGHVATVAIRLSVIRIVEALRSVAGNAANKIAVVVILSAQEILVGGEFFR